VAVSAGAVVLLDPRHLNIYLVVLSRFYFDTEAEVASAVLTIKSDRVYNKIRAQLEVEAAGHTKVDMNQKALNGGDRRAQLIARNQARSDDGRLINDWESFKEKVDKEVLR
jgi:hypothetical protein